MKLRLGTRGSALALARSERVAEILRRGGHEVEVVNVATSAHETSHMPDNYSVGVFAQESRGESRLKAPSVNGRRWAAALPPG
ncbi:hypothetical protein [Aestuariimicrobium ganziense]|uniref:hypothetical protein n=1 Tax=Aestuariimicrobium ganziense TaxID=2773677 RepID=UPI0038B2ADAE